MGGVAGNLTTIAADNGWYYTTANTEVTEEHNGVVVVGDTIISAWTVIDGAQTIDLVEKFNISGVTLTSDFPPLIIPGNMTSVSFRAAATNGGVCLLRG
jgi:hypothetical protein